MNCIDCGSAPPEYGKVRCGACRVAYLADLNARREASAAGKLRRRLAGVSVDEEARVAYEDFMAAADGVAFASLQGTDLWRPTLRADVALRRLCAAFRRAGVAVRDEDGVLVY